MATMAELFTGSMGSAGSARDDYLAYVQACQEMGKPALKYEDWLKAGKPSAPR